MKRLLSLLRKKLFGPSRPVRKAQPYRCRPRLECLEDRELLANYIWMNTTGNGLYGTAANWADAVGGPSAVPGAFDEAHFGFGGAGSNTNCTMNLANTTVNRVIMDANYTATLSVPIGNTLAINSYFAQYGTLALNGTITAGDYVNLNGAVVTSSPRTAGPTAILDADGSMFLNASGSITVAGTSPPGFMLPSLTLTSAGFEDGGTINVGSTTAGVGGTLFVHGAYGQLPDGDITVYKTSVLNFAALGAATYPTFEGTLTMGVGAGGGVSGGSVITTDTQLDIAGGTFSSVGTTLDNLIGGGPGGPNGGTVAIFNGGDFSLGAGNDLAMLDGSLTVGASAPNLAPTGGTMGMAAGSTLLFPGSPFADTFVVTTQGVLSMSGATINMNAGRVAQLLIMEGEQVLPDEEPLPAGQLNSLAAAGAVDRIIGNVLNLGTIAFGGSALHTLAIAAVAGAPPGTTGNYAQTNNDPIDPKSGTLSMRLKNHTGGTVNDLLTVAGTATLGGTLEETAVGTLTPGQTWTVMTYGAVVGDFTTKDFPGPTPPWVGTAGVGGYLVSN